MVESPARRGGLSRGVSGLGWLLGALPIVLLLVGGDLIPPPILSGAGVVGLASFVALARARVLQGPVAAWHQVALAVGLLVCLGLGVVLGSGATVSGGEYSMLCQRMSVALGVVAGLLAAWIAWSSTDLAARGPVLSGVHVDLIVPARPIWGMMIVGLGLAVHGLVLATLPPLIQVDSWCNILEPPLLERANWPFHHPPLYVVIVKALGQGPRFETGLAVLVASQHALVIVLALAIEKTVRLASGRGWIGVLAGLLVATEPHLALYAQLVMTEVVSTCFVTASALLLLEGSAKTRAAPWIVTAGTAAALGTLTRQAMEAWFLVAAAWIVLFGPFRPRWQALTAFLLAALLPVGAMMMHNYVFQGRPILTAATGRNLVYRVVTGMPSLSDPDAPPGDEMERARQLVWEARDRCWIGPYSALEKQLHWTDAQIDKAFQKFYLEQIFRHPLEFTRLTVSYATALLLATEPPEGVTDFHNLVRPHAFCGWDQLPPAPSVPSTLSRLTSLELTSRIVVLLLAFLSPFVARGAARRLSVLSVASVLYFIVLAALVELPLFRYRIPAIPFIVIAAALSVSAVFDRCREVLARRTDTTSPGVPT